MATSKLHPIAKKHGYKSNEDFYKDFPTEDSYEMKYGGQPTQPQGMYWNGKEYKQVSPAIAAGSMYQTGGVIPGTPSMYQLWQNGGMVDNETSRYNMFKDGGIHLNPKNKGKFNATKKATGKTTEELTHSSNPVTRKRAIFAQNASHFKHKYGGPIMQNGGGTLDKMPNQQHTVNSNDPGFERSDPYMKYVDPRLIHELDSLNGTLPALDNLVNRPNNPIQNRIQYLNNLQQQMIDYGKRKDHIPIERKYGGDSRNASHWNKKAYGGPWDADNQIPDDVTAQYNQQVAQQQPIMVNNQQPVVTSDNPTQDMVQNGPVGTSNNNLRPKPQFNWGNVVNKVVDTGIAAGTFINGMNNARQSHEYAQGMGLTDNMSHMNQPGTKGDYTQQGYFRPQDSVPTRTGMFLPSSQYGGNIVQGSNYQLYGVGGQARAQWNQYQQGIQPTQEWNHNNALGTGYNPWATAPIQQDVADLAGGKYGNLGKNSVSTPNGISATDGWVGTKTGAYKYRPLMYEHQDAHGNVLQSKNYGTDYETAIAENTGGRNFYDRPQASTQWQSNDQGLPMAASTPGYTPAPVMQRAQQDNWHTDENTDYSIDSVRQAKFGGNIPGTFNQLDTSWNKGQYMNTEPAPDPYQVKKTLPEAEDPDIIVEKKEQVLGDFAGNGTPSLMGVDTGTHASGNDQGINVPDNSFVFSDTKALKVKDKDALAAFGETKAKTPAAIAKKYDLQKFTAKLQDPKIDHTTRRTAELMTGNYSQKLSALAALQESMKAQKGLQNPQDRMSKFGGKYATGGFRFDEQSPDPITTDYSIPFVGGTPLNQANGVTITAPKNPYSIQGTGYKQMPTGTEPYTPVYSTQSPPIPNNIQADNTSPVSNTMGNSTSNDPYNRKAFSRPDQLAMLNSAINAATIHKYLPWEAPVTGVIPDTVFADPTRAIAANAEQANSAYKQAAANRGSDKLGNYLAIQGQAGTNAANIVGQYANQNVQTANQANQQAAGITNQLLEAKRARANRLHQGNTIAAQEYDNSTREARNDLVNTYNSAWKNRQMLDDINQTSQFFYRDPQTGMMHFNSEEGKAAFMKTVNGQGGTGSGFKSPKDVHDYYTSQGFGEEDAQDAADSWARQNVLGLKDRIKTINKSGKSQTQTTTYGKQQYGGLAKFMK